MNSFAKALSCLNIGFGLRVYCKNWLVLERDELRFVICRNIEMEVYA